MAVSQDPVLAPATNQSSKIQNFRPHLAYPGHRQEKSDLTRALGVRSGASEIRTDKYIEIARINKAYFVDSVNDDQTREIKGQIKVIIQQINAQARSIQKLKEERKQWFEHEGEDSVIHLIKQLKEYNDLRSEISTIFTSASTIVSEVISKFNAESSKRRAPVETKERGGLRQAPKAPKKQQLKRVKFDFDPEYGYSSELRVLEGDIVVVLRENNELRRKGWCEVRMRRERQPGLVPIEYLENYKG